MHERDCFRQRFLLALKPEIPFQERKGISGLQFTKNSLRCNAKRGPYQVLEFDWIYGNGNLWWLFHSFCCCWCSLYSITKPNRKNSSVISSLNHVLRIQEHFLSFVDVIIYENLNHKISIPAADDRIEAKYLSIHLEVTAILIIKYIWINSHWLATIQTYPLTKTKFIEYLRLFKDLLSQFNSDNFTLGYFCKQFRVTNVTIKRQNKQAKQRIWLPIELNELTEIIFSWNDQDQEIY